MSSRKHPPAEAGKQTTTNIGFGKSVTIISNDSAIYAGVIKRAGVAVSGKTGSAALGNCGVGPFI